MLSVIPFSDSTGSITRHTDWSSRYVTSRAVDVWCPPDYATSAAHYQVIYMHDGKWLFDAALLDGGVDWGIDEALTRLMKDQHIRGAIVVGIWTSPEQRSHEYMPQKPLGLPEAQTILERFRADEGGDPISDRYLQFLVNEVKLFIDRTYRTLAVATCEIRAFSSR